MEVVEHRKVVRKEVVDRHIVMDKVVVEDELAFDNIVADNIEAADHMVVNIGVGSIVIVNIVDIGVDNHNRSLDMLLGIRTRNLKDSHHILVGHNYIDKSRCFAPPY